MPHDWTKPERWHAGRKTRGAMRRLAFVLVLFASPLSRAEDDPLDHAGMACACDATPAACDAACACDSECDVDWTADECADPAAGCQPEVDLDDAALAAAALAAPENAMPIEWTTAAAQVTCPDGAHLDNGTCVADSLAAADVSGGCSTGRVPGLLIAGAVIALVIMTKRRRAWLVMAFGACSLSGGSWDDAVDDGPTGDPDRVDVFSADLGDGDGVQFLLANQSLQQDAQEPVAQFSLAKHAEGIAIVREPGTCGDKLVATTSATGAQLLGWARPDAGDGTAALVELTSPEGCEVYETDPEAVATLIAQSYTPVGTIAYVWPPGMSETPPAEDPPSDPPATIDGPAPCTITAHSAVELLYASPGKDETLRFLLGCPGEVIVGEKRETGPIGAMKSAAAKAAGGRTAFVLDRNGDKLRALLARPNGVERTAAYLKHKLAIGYDYIVIDEVTAAPDYRDGGSLNTRLRQLLLRMPARTIIPYISIDLTQELSFDYMHNRRLLLRAFKRRARALALEVYLHTPQTIAGAAPAAFRRATDRVAAAVHGLAGVAGISRMEITTIGTSIHGGSSNLAQYEYLDEPSRDLGSITRQVNAIRHGSKRLRAQHGVGWYFVNKSDMAPRGGAPYSYDGLIRRMRLQGLRFK